MRTAIAVLVVTLAMVNAGLAGDQAEAGRDSGPMFRAPVPVVEVELANEWVVGIGYNSDDNHFWLSQIAEPTDTPMYHKVSEWGVITNSYPQGGVYGDFGHNDIHGYGSYFYGSECWYIKRFDAEGWYDGWTNFQAPYPTFNPYNPCRSVTHDPFEDYWYVGGWGTKVYKGQWDGVNGSMPAWQPITPSAMNGVNGLAYDWTRGWVWASDSIDTKLYRLNPEGGAPIGVITSWGYGYGSPRGLCVASTVAHGDVLGATFVNAGGSSWFVLFDLDSITPVEAKSWTSIKALYR